ncbi:MAG: efflux RND transporter permease subunit [Smithella sp.]|jgi:multidrug efflux pump subunit AcrB
MKTSNSKSGVSGWLADRFVTSKLTPLLMVVVLSIGFMAIWATPKEDDPSLVVASADVAIAYPGRGAKEIDERIAKPVGQWIKELRSVKHVYSSTADDAVMFSIEFHSGIPQDKALSELYQQINANVGRLPSGTSAPLIKPRGVDDVAVLTATLSSNKTGPDVLRRLAVEMADKLRALPNVSRVDITGGLPRTINVELDARKLAERGLGADRVLQAIRASNVRLPAGKISGPGGVHKITVGAFIKSAEDTASLIVGANQAGPVYLRDIAKVSDGFAEPTNYVSRIGDNTNWSAYPAVTISINKIYGSNVTDVTRQAKEMLNGIAKKILPADVNLDITRDNGQVAITTLQMVLKHMLIALLVSVFLIIVTLGWREGVISGITLVITLLSIPIVYMLTGFTLNRISMAAIVFAIGLLIDNAIVVIENIHRHWHSGDEKTAAIAVKAVEEVGPPTILATLLVIIALVPTAFVSGMTGQYLRPLPVGASIGMLFSLFIALTVTPYLCNWILRSTPNKIDESLNGDDTQKKKELKSYYLDALAFILAKPSRAFSVYAISITLLVAMVALIPARIAIVEAMPHKNSDELSVMIDMVPSTNLESTYAKAVDVARILREIPEVTACQVYAGTSAPLTFLGVARHYDFRTEPDKAEIHVQLKPEKERKRPSHETALQMHSLIVPMLSGKDTFFAIAELPPGPPTLAGIVAEVYAPDEEQRLQSAQKVKTAFSKMPDVISVDWTARLGAPELEYEIDLQKAAMRGVIGAQAADTVRTLIAGDASTMAQLPDERDGVPITVRLSRSQRKSPEDIDSLLFTSIMDGMRVPASDIGKLKKNEGAYPFMRKDLQPVVMVLAESTGDGATYSMKDISRLLKKEKMPDSKPIEILWKDKVIDQGIYALNWAGYWTIQRDVYSDLGMAFVAVLFLIYAMLVAWYGSFLTPLIVMLPIPLLFIGVIPAHALLGKAIDGVGTVGVIALAGIVLRNSILLVDFARSHIAEGMIVKEAVLKACSLRVRPIIITALAIILGESVLYFDETMQGLGITMPSGTFISTLLTLFVVPIAYYQLESLQQKRALKKASYLPEDI